MKCERNIAGPEEDCGGQITYVPCRKPAFWYIEQRYGCGWAACEEHCLEALREGDPTVTGEDGEPVELDDDGEIAVAS